MKNDTLKVFIDTNVLMDLLYRRNPFFDDAQTIFWLAEQKRVKLQISALSFVNSDYVCKRYGYSHDMFRIILSKIEKLVDIPDLGQIEIHESLQSSITDFEDAVQISCAKKGQADVIITRNLDDFIQSTISCFSPHDFILKYKHLLAES